MNREQFERGYAKRGMVTVEWLHQNGRCAVPCDCGDRTCLGWQMVYAFDDLSPSSVRLPNKVRLRRSVGRPDHEGHLIEIEDKRLICRPV